MINYDFFIFLFISFILILLSFYLFIDLYFKIKDNNNEKTIQEILEINEDLLVKLLDRFIKEEIFKKYLTKKDTLSSEEIENFIKDGYALFINMLPKKEYKKINKLTNNSFDNFIIKSIYSYIVNLEIDTKAVMKRKLGNV